ncbi:LysR family transcriptional regulator [Streptomyces armeniacus]|uniref:LysR family transcriptional regulator n=2 Tax=Streptomyces armeniacus TaxID=83291 RepID=A0A345Y1N5_9ACTN|nr:LysR family transcriptional regulator [Streptomyces armeniacus]
MDQLRTLLAVYDTGTALSAARLLGREQSSVQKQLDTLNRNLGSLYGEPLVLKRGRGRNVRFTGTGEALVELARSTLNDWLDGMHANHHRLARTLSIGSTRYTLGYLLNAVELVNDGFEQDGVELKMSHVRTGDLLDRLRSGELDLACGSVLTTEDDEDDRLADFEVLEWRRSGLSLVTNLDGPQLPGSRLGVTELPKVPLVVSSRGLISGFLKGWFGDEYRRTLNVAAEIDAVHYGFDLLRSGAVRGCMLVTEGIGEAVAEGWLPEASGLRTAELVDDSARRSRVLVGVFARRGERVRHGPDHPLSQLWDALARVDSSWRAEMGEPSPPPRCGVEQPTADARHPQDRQHADDAADAHDADDADDADDAERELRPRRAASAPGS